MDENDQQIGIRKTERGESFGFWKNLPIFRNLLEKMSTSKGIK